MEAAWVAVLNDTHWKREFDRLSRRMSEKKAIVAIAHKLLVVVWHVLTERTADTEADPKLVASKLMIWSKRLAEEARGGLTTSQFVRYHLMQLRLGDDLKVIGRGKGARSLASAEEVLAVRPELMAGLWSAGDFDNCLSSHILDLRPSPEGLARHYSDFSFLYYYCLPLDSGTHRCEPSSGSGTLRQQFHLVEGAPSSAARVSLARFAATSTSEVTSPAVSLQG